MNRWPTGYESVALPLSYTGLKLDFTLNLDPKLRKKLLNEVKKPFLGIRRVIWISLTGSAGIGLLIMVLRFASGETVLINDLGIQVLAFFIFTMLIVFDRPKN